MKQKRYFIPIIIFFFFGIFFATSQKASALCYSAQCVPDGLCGPKMTWVNYGNYSFTIASDAEKAAYKDLKIRLDTCEYGKTRTLINGNPIAEYGPAPTKTCGYKEFTLDISGYLAVGNNAFSCDGMALDSPDVIPGCTITAGTPPACNLIATPPTITIGESTALTWLAAGATSASIDNGIDISSKPPAGGSISASPKVDTTYKMTGSDGCSSFTCSASVTVKPPNCTLSADPDGVISGGKTELSWVTLGSDLSKPASINNGVGASLPVASGRASTGVIISDTTYTMTFTGIDSKTYTCSKTVGLIIPPTGGLVPCGRLADNPATGDIDESKPCSLCAGFYLLKNIINFVVTLAIGIGVFILVIAGLLYAFSIGNSRRIEQAKSAITSALTGIGIIFIAWLVIAVILQGLGYANIATWNQVNCLI